MNLKELVRVLVQSADDAGCTDDLTVVSKRALEAVEERLNEPQTAWVVSTAYDNDQPSIAGVYSTREAAEAYAASIGDDYRLAVYVNGWPIQ